MHPYRKETRAADPEASDTLQRSTGLLVAAILEAAAVFHIAWMAPTTLRDYADLFKGFGAELPGATLFVLRSERLWYALAALGLAQLMWVIIRQRMLPAELRWMKISVRGYGILLGVLVAFTVYALYVPIFSMGAVV